jgi:hypothetical protein
MPYKYDLYDTANMSNQEMLNALMAREIAPRVIVGTGYKNGRQVAIDYLKEQIAKEGGANSKPCDNCPSGDPAIYEVMTLSGELALCESCHSN